MRTPENAPSAGQKMPSANLLGVRVHAVNMERALATIDRWIARREQHYLIAAPAHCLMACQRSEALRSVYNNAGLVTPDGMPIVWVLKLMGFSGVDRVYGPDLMLMLCQRGIRRGYRHYLYGGNPVLVENLAAQLGRRFPGIQIAGTHAPPFPYTAEDDDVVTARINAAKPDIVWCGLGVAKEEYWTNRHLGRLAAPALIGVGAAFDFHSGAKKQAPYWMQRSGLEWLFRTMIEPRRLGPRYLLDNPLFVWRIAMQVLGRKPAPI